MLFENLAALGVAYLIAKGLQKREQVQVKNDNNPPAQPVYMESLEHPPDLPRVNGGVDVKLAGAWRLDPSKLDDEDLNFYPNMGPQEPQYEDEPGVF